jgi:hypothetical protein
MHPPEPKGSAMRKRSNVTGLRFERPRVVIATPLSEISMRARRRGAPVEWCADGWYDRGSAESMAAWYTEIGRDLVRLVRHPRRRSWAVLYHGEPVAAWHVELARKLWAARVT